MDSVWGNNGLTSVNCGGSGVWGNPGSSLSRGSIWSSSGSGKRSSGDSWSSLETDSKLENSGWGGLTSDGSSYRGRNGSPGSNIGASAGPDSDADPWGQSSGHGSSSSWGSASTSDNKDASGWGSLDPSPVPNAGTESWGFRPGTNSGSAENKSNDWKQSGDTKNAPNVAKDAGSSFLLPDESGRSVSGEPKRGSQSQFQSEMSSLWGSCGSVSGSSHGQDAGNSETNQTDAAQQSQQQQQQLEASGCNVKGAGTAGNPEMAMETLSRDEIIRRAVNSNEGWGKTPIRQDTAWNIDDEPKKPFPLAKADDISVDRNRPTARDRSGSASWNPSAEIPGLTADRARTGSAIWSSVVSENSGLGMILKEMRGDLGGPELGGKALLPSDKLPETGWQPRPVTKDVEWGSNLTLTDGSSWESGKKEVAWDAAESGGIGKVSAGQTLSRSSSASTWSSDEGDGRGWSKGDSKGPVTDKGPAGWTSEQADAQNWKPGYKSSTSVPPPTESLFNVPPPQFGGDGFGGLVGPWGNTLKQSKPMDGWGDGPQWAVGAADQRSRAPSTSDWNAPDASRRGLSMGNMGDVGKPPQMRAHLLQRLMDMGFKKEDAQAALISNNLNMESTISKLLANQMRGVAVENDLDPTASRRQFQSGANHVNELSMLSARGDLPPDVAACLVNLLQNTPNASAGSVPLGSHLGGAAATTQMRSPPGGSVPAFTPNHLAMLSSFSPGLLPALQQKLVQPGLRADGNQAAQVSALQQALLQNVQGAIQANLIPPHLITAQSLTPTVLIKLQQMMEMYQALQGLSARYQLLLQDNIVLVQARQRPQNLGEIEAIMASFKQQIYQTQQQVLQELTILQPPPPPSTAGMDQLLKNFASLQAKDDTFPGPSLMNQWKVASSGDDAAGILGHPASSNPTLQQQHSISMPASQADAAAFGLDGHWLPSMTSCWTRPGSASTELASTGRCDDGASVNIPYTSAVSTEGTAMSTAESTVASASEDGTVASQLEIAEFIPGIPWQGLATKGADDDLHLTPGSVVQGSMVLNSDAQSGGAVKLASSSSLAPGSLPDPAQGSAFTGISKSSISNANLSAKVSPWSPVDSSLTSDPWARNQSIPSAISSYQNKMSYQHQQQQQLQAPNRTISWSGGDRNAYKPLPPSSPSLPSDWLRLKNIAPQVDNRTLQALCEQHGPLECFVPNLTREYVIVKYMKLDDACKAQRSLNMCPIAGQSLLAEYLNKYEVFQLLQQAPTGVHTQASKPFSNATSSPYQLPVLGKAVNADRWNLPSGAPFGSSAGLGSGANPWSMSSEEHGLYLPNSKHL